MCGHSIGRRIFTTTRFAAFILMLEDNMKKGLQNNHLGFLEDYDNHNLNSDKTYSVRPIMTETPINRGV